MSGLAVLVIGVVTVPLRGAGLPLVFGGLIALLVAANWKRFS